MSASLSNDRLLTLKVRIRQNVMDVPAAELHRVARVSLKEIVVLEDVCNSWAMALRPADASSAPEVGALCHTVSVPTSEGTGGGTMPSYRIEFENYRFRWAS